MPNGLKFIHIFLRYKLWTIGRGHMNNKMLLKVESPWTSENIRFFFLWCCVSFKCFDYFEFILTIHMIIDNNNVLYQTHRLVRVFFWGGRSANWAILIIIKPSSEDTMEKRCSGDILIMLMGQLLEYWMSIKLPSKEKE